MSGAASDPCFIITSVGVTFIICRTLPVLFLCMGIKICPVNIQIGKIYQLICKYSNAVNTDGVEV
jgi:hypothetical protein